TKRFHPRSLLARRIGRESSGSDRIHRIGVRLASAACNVAPSIRGDPNKSVVIRVLIVAPYLRIDFALWQFDPPPKSRATAPGCDPGLLFSPSGALGPASHFRNRNDQTVPNGTPAISKVP